MLACLDGQLNPESTEAAFSSIDAGAVHPLTGPVMIKGASPGDLLEVEFLDIQPEPWGFSAIMPGMGFLRDILGRPDHEHAMLLMPVGYPAEGARVPDLQRKDLDEVSEFLE